MFALYRGAKILEDFFFLMEDGLPKVQWMGTSPFHSQEVSSSCLGKNLSATQRSPILGTDYSGQDHITVGDCFWIAWLVMKPGLSDSDLQTVCSIHVANDLFQVVFVHFFRDSGVVSVEVLNSQLQNKWETVSYYVSQSGQRGCTERLSNHNKQVSIWELSHWILPRWWLLRAKSGAVLDYCWVNRLDSRLAVTVNHYLVLEPSL